MQEHAAAELIDSLSDANAIVMTNCIAATVTAAFDGERRGIAGDAICDASVTQVEMFSGLARQQQSGLRLVGVGGIASADHVRRYLLAGAHSVQLATAAMIDPRVGLAIRPRLVEKS
jgi:dihydroorotate dehydrogenase